MVEVPTIDHEKALKFFDYLHKEIVSVPKLLNLTGGESQFGPSYLF